MYHQNADSIELLKRREPFFWANPGWQPLKTAAPALPYQWNLVEDAVARWHRFQPLLAHLFPELQTSAGVIESPLLELKQLAGELLPGGGRLLVKADHALPVAGSIKARGGVYAVLHFAEKVALANGLLSPQNTDYLKLAGDEARRLFSDYKLTVGSTGNLGLSIGVAGKALGFTVEVHMSIEAKEWKKERLRRIGVKVVEHQSDYTAACKVTRAAAAQDPYTHFIDDENSLELFAGYAAALPHLATQLQELNVKVDATTPLFVHLPCGVGGAPGGIAFAARHLFGDNLYPLFVEPVDAPCMVLGMLTGQHSDISVYDLGLNLKTDADGLAVSTPSRFVGQLMEPLLSGCVTLEDATLYRLMLQLYETTGMELEPSAAAGFASPAALLRSNAGSEFLAHHKIDPQTANHLVWTTGGSFVPPAQHELYRQLARSVSLAARRANGAL